MPDYKFQKLPKFGEKYFRTGEFDLCLASKWNCRKRPEELTFVSEGLARRQDVGDEKDRVRDAEGDQQLIESAPGKVGKNKKKVKFVTVCTRQ